MRIDVQQVRRDFPALSRTWAGRPVVYFDNAATTLKPTPVIEAITRYYTGYSGNIHRGKHLFSEEASEAFESARERVAQFINAAPEETIFVRGTTEGINLLAAGLALRPEDNVVGTVLEHHSNILPWRARCEYRGAPLTPSGLPDLAAAEALVDDRTRLLTVTYCSNVTGVKVPIDQWVGLSKRKGIPLLVDAAQAAPHVPIDVRALDCDFLVLSGHKMMGPTGAGVLYGKRARLEAIDPVNLGGGTVSIVRDDFSYELRDLPFRLEAGTPDIAAVIGLGAAIDYIGQIGMETIAAHEATLSGYLEEHIATLPDIWCYKPGAEVPHIATVAFNDRRGVLAADFLSRVLNDTFGVMVRAGHHCAHPLHELIAPSGTLRASLYLYNTEQEVICLRKGLQHFLRHIQP